MTRTARLALAPQNKEEWSRLFKLHKEEYLRKRLRAINLCWDGLSQNQVKRQLGCSQSSLHRWIDSYLDGGFTKLLGKWISGNSGKGKLTKIRKRILRYIILKKSPMDYAYQSGVWTLDLLIDLLNKKWDISLQKSQLYVILNKDLGLSHQKFHRDYQEADKGKQKQFLKDLDKALSEENQEVIWFDEFSLSTRTEAGYGWAVINSSPRIASREKKENVVMCC